MRLRALLPSPPLCTLLDQVSPGSSFGKQGLIERIKGTVKVIGAQLFYSTRVRIRLYSVIDLCVRSPSRVLSWRAVAHFPLSMLYFTNYRVLEADN